MKSLLTTLAFATAISASAQNNITVNAQKLGAPIPKTMYGIFFEDINFAADGGLYAELVKNRSFEFPNHLQGWTAFGKFEVRNDNPAYDRNPNYVRLIPVGHRHKRTGLENSGFFGIGLKKGEEYRISFTARRTDDKDATIRIQLIDPSNMGEVQFIQEKEAKIAIDSKEWKKYTAIIKSKTTIDKAHLRVLHAGASAVDIDHISLFPVDTWKGHENGMRKDLAQALADLKPGVFRFPGGCIVEGTEEGDRYNWKNSVGAVENRPLNLNRWQYTFEHRFYPDYYQSYGLGFYEYFLLSEEIGAEPLPILSCGLVCQYQNNDKVHTPVEELKPYIQDALDLIEFANGATTTTWGKLRAEMGHPEPFNLKYIGIGNEQWGDIYPAHLKPFIDALRKAHPEVKIVGSSGPDSEGKKFDYLWPEMKKLKADLVDEHFYRPADWFLKSGNRYDNYDRKGPKVFAGEYACHIKGKKYNQFYASLLEAAFMTGLERNADVVEMATYAPLFAHVEGWQWRPDLIWFDNLRSFRSCSYLVQQLYSQYKGSNVVSLTMDNKPVAGNEGQNGLFASAVFDKASSSYIVKVANTSKESQPLKVSFKLKNKKQKLAGAHVITLQSDNLEAENTLDEPNKISTKESNLTISGNCLDTTIAPESFVVYIVK
ncbi:MAG: carbohydrate binding domain-containing protein [Bacteroidaceae bacterium]|nr:carbohydrate binding domain-containing protein [Bacteroidaceae bacterium]